MKIESLFFRTSDQVSRFKVIDHIDKNTRKLKKKEPKFYSITLNPSPQELKYMDANPEKLKAYTRKVMENYASHFHNEINDRPVNINDIVYYAKVEQKRYWSYKDKEVRENRSVLKEYKSLNKKIHNIQKGKENGNIKLLKDQIASVKKRFPHTQNGQPILEGLEKTGPQAHVHIIVSRKDASNRF